MPLSKINIAIADDHSLLRDFLIDWINSIPHCTVVTDANDGKELIDKISNLESVPDLCILDISMPNLNGYDTVTALKKIYTAMKFLVLTMFEKEYSIIRMIMNGANGYLLKGCRKEELQKAIMDIHTNGYYYSTAASERAFVVVKNNYQMFLTEKEQQFLSLCCSELSFCEIAKIMYVSVDSIKKYQKTIGEKLNIHTRMGLALFAVQTGLVSIKSTKKQYSQ